MNVKRAARVTINREFASADRFLSEYVTNISQSGIFIRSDDPLSPGTTVNLRFTIIMDDMEIFEGVGEVVRVSHDPPGMGVVFVQLTPRSKQLIQRLLRRR